MKPDLLAAADEVASRAYVPYSHFPVGAALLTDDGRVACGCNVENAAYGATICAERNAITTAVADGLLGKPGQRIAAIAVVGRKSDPCWPCGTCRQVLREFNCRQVLVKTGDGTARIFSFDELLPHSFGPEALEG